ncbi:RNA pseudouridine synthase [Streptomyces tremellae]|uniref:RNA pseudouridylate synthase n=1 Tax=Streptomyces tremellae TaxID=1124239 RepID=A0ABP7DJF2_9ACTN
MGTTDWNWRDLRTSSLLAEDEAILALDKPSGISVMGERHDTDVVELAGEAGERLFPVHRIDKATSGVILFAKDLSRHGGLTRQFNKRTVDKAYLVVTETVGLPDEGTIELPLSVGRKNRVRIAAPREAIRTEREGPHGRWWAADEDLLDTRRYPSTTLFRRVYEGPRHSLLVARPVTGRRHQIRVHLAWTGHPVLGDPLFDRAAAQAGSRTFLHSWRLGFDADWRGGERLALEAAPSDAFFAPLGDGLSAQKARALLAEVRVP